MKTHVEKLMELYADLEPGVLLRGTSVLDCMGVGDVPHGERGTLRTWNDRQWDIIKHLYSRHRDECRAHRVNDFDLARALDAAETEGI